MPCINHKRKSSKRNNHKTSRKSKHSTKHKFHSFRNKKTRSNLKKMRGGGEDITFQVTQIPQEIDISNYNISIIKFNSLPSQTISRIRLCRKGVTSGSGHGVSTPPNISMSFMDYGSNMLIPSKILSYTIEIKGIIDNIKHENCLQFNTINLIFSKKQK